MQIRGTDPVTNNGLFIDQEPGVVDFTLSVIAPSSENATAQLFDPLSIPNIRLVTRIGGSQEEQRSQPMRVALEADGRDAEIFVTEDRCPQGYGHAVVTDWGMPCSDGLRLVLSDVDATKMVQVFGTTGAYLGALPFIAAESCAETSPADLCGCIDPQDFDPEVWRVDVPMRYTAPYPGDVAILAFPRP